MSRRNRGCRDRGDRVAKAEVQAAYPAAVCRREYGLHVIILTPGDAPISEAKESLRAWEIAACRLDEMQELS
jgi:hypothetical protein